MYYHYIKCKRNIPAVYSTIAVAIYIYLCIYVNYRLFQYTYIKLKCAVSPGRINYVTMYNACIYVYAYILF